MLGTDSHTCTAGAFGQFATGIGNTDAGFVLGTGKILLKVCIISSWFLYLSVLYIVVKWKSVIPVSTWKRLFLTSQVPPTMRFILDGEMPSYLQAKDLILQVSVISLLQYLSPSELLTGHFRHKSEVISNFWCATHLLTHCILLWSHFPFQTDSFNVYSFGILSGVFHLILEFASNFVDHWWNICCWCNLQDHGVQWHYYWKFDCKILFYFSASWIPSPMGLHTINLWRMLASLTYYSLLQSVLAARWKKEWHCATWLWKLGERMVSSLLMRPHLIMLRYVCRLFFLVNHCQGKLRWAMYTIFLIPLQNRTSVPFEPVYSDGNARYDRILNIDKYCALYIEWLAVLR